MTDANTQTPAHSPFFAAHGTAPRWDAALELVLAQLVSQAKAAQQKLGTLGFVYFTEAFAPHASSIVTLLKVRTGIMDWVGGTSPSIFGGAVEYTDEPALVVMTANLPRQAVHIFSPANPLLSEPAALLPELHGLRNSRGALLADLALVHAEGSTPYLQDLLRELRARLAGGELFGGIVAGRQAARHVATSALGNVFDAGLSGAVFASEVDVRVQVSHGCYPLKPNQAAWKVLESDGHWLLALSRDGQGESAFTALLRELGLLQADETLDDLDREALKKAINQGIFIAVQSRSSAAISSPSGLSHPSRLRDAGYVVRNIVGIDPARGAIMVSEALPTGAPIRFCKRDAAAAKADLLRACTALREEIEEEQLQAKGVLLISCLGRGEHLFGQAHVEPALVQRALGTAAQPLPLVGFAAAGEIAGEQLHGFTTVLAVFV